jgi:hypothetical protein
MWVSAILSGILAGIVASLVSIAIERFGGAVGGILGSSPTTLMPAAVGLWITLTTEEYSQRNIVRFQKSMLIICPSMLVTGLFLWCWKIMPNYFSKHSIRLENNTKLLLLVVSLASYGVWLIGAVGFVYLSRALSTDLQSTRESVRISFIITDQNQNRIFFMAIIGFLTQLVIGVWGTWHTPSTPKSTAHVPLWSNILRGTAAGMSIFLAVVLGKVDPVVGGVTSMFPAIFGTAMVSVWLTSGSKVSIGAIEPLILGSLSVSLFAFNFAFMMPYFQSVLIQGWDVAAAVTVCYTLSVSTVCIPSYLFVSWRQRVFLVEKKTAEEADSTETSTCN